MMVPYTTQVLKHSKVSTALHNTAHMYPMYILSHNGTEFKKQLNEDALKQMALVIFFPPHTIHKAMENWRYVTYT